MGLKLLEVLPEEATAENNYTVDGVTYDSHVETVEVKVENTGGETSDGLPYVRLTARAYTPKNDFTMPFIRLSFPPSGFAKCPAAPPP